MLGTGGKRWIAGRRMARRAAAHFAAAVFAVVCLGAASAPAGEPVRWRHALSLTGEPKYPLGFRHPDYVNPLAPKGGRVRLGALGAFDNFNPFVSGVKGKLAAFLMTIYEPLLMVSLDEPTTEYGLLAEALSVPDDQSSVAFRLRPEARWHDGRPVTADDVIFSYETWKRLSPQWSRVLSKVAAVERMGEREIRFVFSETGDAALPLYVGQMSVLPRHWWTGRDAEGKPRDVEATTLEPPLGSGPYRLGAFVAGRSLVYERVASYWGMQTPIRVGTGNFDRVEVEYLRDPNVMLEAFKADLIDLRRETSLKSWAVGYDVASVRDRRIVRETFGIERLGIVKAFVFNLRRPKFADVRVRKALAMAFDFDEVNRNFFHGLLPRPGSFYPHTDFEAAGPLSRDERLLLSALPAAPEPRQLEAAAAPRTGGARADLYNSLELLREAGWRLKDGRLRDRSGEQLTLEFVLEDAALERVAGAYAAALAKLGIAATVRVVDEVQYQNRLRSFDFDIAAHAWVQGHAPGSEQRDYWSAASADAPGANNLPGVRMPFVDALVERLVLAPTRAEKVAAGRLLDRTLRDAAIGAPFMTEDREFVARWDRFGRPERMPRYGAAAFPMLWWWDEAKAAKVGGRGR